MNFTDNYITSDMFDRSCAEIDLSALINNYREIRKATSPDAKVLCVVKADAYGHGAVEVAKALQQEGAEGFCLATVDEAVDLRKNGITSPLMLLGYTADSRYADVVKYDIEQAVYSLQDAKTLAAEAQRQGKRARIHFKIDTGMGRIGFASDGSDNDMMEEIANMEGLEPYGIFSHFSVADMDDDEYTRAQYDRFMSVINDLESRGIEFKMRHICNSAGIMRFPGMHLDAVRAGIILYGLMPQGCPEPEVKINLIPVMSWYAKVIFEKTIPAGTSVSYGRRYISQKQVRVATVGIGYADGFSRRFSNGFELMIEGKMCPILGSVCMDMCMADVSSIEGPIPKETLVTLFGKTRPADDLAEWLGTINYEITCDVGRRVNRIYTMNGKVI